MRRPTSTPRRGAGLFLVLYSALGFGLIPIFALLAYRGGINVITLLAIRFALSGLVLLAFLLARGRRVLAQAASVWLGLLGLGVCYTLQSGFYFSAVRYITASLASILLYSYPAFVCLLAFLVERERMNARLLLALAVSLAGVALVLGASLGVASPAGVSLALGAAVVYSLYITLANRVLRNVEPVVALAVVTLVTSAVYIGLGLAAGRLRFGFAPSTWLPIALLIAVSTLLAIPAFFRGIEILGSSTASIVSMTEPLFTIGFSILLFGDRLGWQQIIGGALVLGGTALVTTSRSRPDRFSRQDHASP
jgi:drug/metabolite transporter (DMT)-like permease